MKTAIIGLPMTGKSSLFTILTGVHESARMGSMEVRVGVAKVPDARLTALAAIFNPLKITQATVEYLDTPSISKESLRDTGLLASLRVADAFAHVLRVFESDTVPHEKGSVDPLRDADDVDTELILSDLVVVEKRMERVEKDRKKSRSAELDREFDLLSRCKASLEDNKPLRGMVI
jgi:ribosome-binding ATPase YchF (GTP1/OBG family)